MRCSSCRKELPDIAKFCSACGTPITIQQITNDVVKQPNTELMDEQEQLNPSQFSQDTEKDKQEFFLIKYWKGHCELGSAFRSYIYMGIAAKYIIMKPLQKEFTKQGNQKPGLLITIAMFIAVYLFVGLLRSSYRYKGKPIWRYLTYVLALITLLRLVQLWFIYFSIL